MFVECLQVRAAGEGRAGRTATCLTASKDGAVKFSVKKRTGLFMDGGRLDMWIKSNTKSNSPYASSTPAGQPPNLKIFLMNVSIGHWDQAAASIAASIIAVDHWVLGRDQMGGWMGSKFDVTIVV